MNPSAPHGHPRAEGSPFGDSGDGLPAFHDVVVVPSEELLDSGRDLSDHRGGPIWPDWERQEAARHRRGGRPIDHEPSGNVAVPDRMATLAWGGPIVRHFGHQLADFSNRLLAYAIAKPDIAVGFSTKSGHFGPGVSRDPKVMAEAPDYVKQILAWYGIPLVRCRLITAPVAVSELIVAPQAEMIGGPGPSPSALDALDRLTAMRLGDTASTKYAVTYVSRAGQRWRFAGEGYLEAALQASGVHIMRPESLPLIDQMREYYRSESLVFAEGSALHALQLGGRLDSDVTVLVRRPGHRLAVTSLEPRLRKLDYVEISKHIVHGLLPSGKPALSIGMSVPDEEMLMAVLGRAGVHLGRSWNSPDFKKTRDEDLREWLRGEARRMRPPVAGSTDTVLTTLERTGLTHLVGEARRVLPPADMTQPQEPHRPID